VRLISFLGLASLRCFAFLLYLLVVF
jgi:hypothetical protein